MTVVEEPVQLLRRRSALTDASLEMAREHWQRITDALEAGVREEGDKRLSAANLRHRFNSIRRLTSEARQMILLSTAPDPSASLYAIDPHLIRGYCTFWDTAKFTAFDFMPNEWMAGEEKDRLQFIVYLLGSVLRMPNLICLEAGRQEISEMLSSFLDGHVRGASSQPDDQVATFERGLDEIKNTAKVSQAIGTDPSEISRFILQKFEALIETGGIPLMQQHLSISRLVQFLKTGNLKSPFGAISHRVSEEHQEKVQQAERLFMGFWRDADAVRAARTSFYRAYTTFARATTTDDSGRLSREIVSGDIERLRPGELSNIHAIFEIHAINVALEAAEVPVKLRYVTDSTALFAFSSAFAPGDLMVDLVHPRHVFMFENRADSGHLGRFQAVFGGPNAFVGAVTEDGIIRLSELQKFEHDNVGLMRDVRSTYTFASVDNEAERSALAKVMQTFVSKYGGERREELRAKLQNIVEMLANTSAAVREAFSEAAPELSVQGFESYKDFVEGLAGTSRRSTMLVRSFAADGKEAGVSRLVCLLLSGGYRHIVKIYEPTVIQDVGKPWNENVGCIDVSAFMNRTKARGAAAATLAAGVDGPEADPVVRAVPDFLRALYGMVGREWLLAQTFCKASLAELGWRIEGEESPLEPCSGDSPEARRRLMGHEVLLLQHYARRGIAANFESGSRRRRWLSLALDDLHSAGSLLTTVFDLEGFATAYEPNSVRLSLAAFGLLIEQCVQARIVDPTRPLILEEHRTALPATERAELAWLGLTSLTGTAVDSAGQYLDALSQDLDQLNARIAGIQKNLTVDARGINHSPELWRFIALRGLEVRCLLDLLHRLKIVQLSEPRADAMNASKLGKLLLEHQNYVATACGPEVSPQSKTVHPFGEFLVIAHRLLDETAQENGADDVSAFRKGEYLLAISRLHNELSRAGFARAISRQLLSNFGLEAAEELRRLADLLEREWALSRTV
jgi:hypothetical protein